MISAAAGRRDVAGASNRTGSALAQRQLGGPIQPSPLRKAALRTPKPLRPQSMRLSETNDDKENMDVQKRPCSLQLAKGGFADGLGGKEGFRKRIVISPSQWFSKTKNTPKATRCTIRDSPSHAGAIATLRDNNRVRVLRELHRKIIQSSTQAELNAGSYAATPAMALGAESIGAAVDAEAALVAGSSPPSHTRDTLHEKSSARRKSLTPSRSPSRAAEAMSASPPTPTPFSQRVAEEDVALAANTESNPLAHSSSGGWKVVFDDATPISSSKEGAAQATTAPESGPEAEESANPTKTPKEDGEKPRADDSERGNRGGVWYMPDSTLSTPVRPSPRDGTPHDHVPCLTPMAESKQGQRSLEGTSVIDDDYSMFVRCAEDDGAGLDKVLISSYGVSTPVTPISLAVQTPKVKQETRCQQPSKCCGTSSPQQTLSMMQDQECDKRQGADPPAGLEQAPRMEDLAVCADDKVQMQEGTTTGAGAVATRAEQDVRGKGGAKDDDEEEARQKAEQEEKGKRAAQKRAAFLAKCQARSHATAETAEVTAAFAGRSAGALIGTESITSQSDGAGEAAAAHLSEAAEAPPPNGAETPERAVLQGKCQEHKAEQEVSAGGWAMHGRQFEGKIKSILPPALANLSEEARKHVERAASASRASALDSISDQSVSSAVQSAMGAIASAHAYAGASALGTLASSRGKMDIDVDMGAPTRKDTRPDRLKLVGSAAFQERLAMLKKQGHLHSDPTAPQLEPPTAAMAANPVNTATTTPKHAGTRGMPCSPDEDDSPIAHPDTQLSQRSMNRSRHQSASMMRASLNKKPFKVLDAQAAPIPKARPSAGERSLTLSRSGGSPHSSVASSVSVDEEEENLLQSVHHRVDTTPSVNGETICAQREKGQKIGGRGPRAGEETSLLASPFAAPLSFISKFFQHNSAKAPPHIEAPETTAKWRVVDMSHVSQSTCYSHQSSPERDSGSNGTATDLSDAAGEPESYAEGVAWEDFERLASIRQLRATRREIRTQISGILAMLEEEEDEEENDEHVRQNQNMAAETSTTRRQNRSWPSSSAADAIEPPWFVKVKRASETAVTAAPIGAALSGHTEASKLLHGNKSAHKLTAACEQERAAALGP